MGGNVFHITHVLVAAFDFEAANARIHQRRQVGALVVVFHAQYVFVVGDKAAFGIDHLVGQAAGLAALAPIGAAPGVGVADIALAAVGHAQGAVHKEFQRTAAGVDGGADGGNLLQRQLAGQHDLREAHVLQKTRLLGGANVGLGAGVQLDGGDVQFQQAHVLHDECIHSCVIQFPGQLAGTF